MRDYDRIVRNLEALRPAAAQVQSLGTVEGLPVHRVRIGAGGGRPTVLLLGGTHGDEPAGVETCLSLAAGPLRPWLGRFDFEMVPCLNPYGYVHDQRHNAQDVDLNWAYTRDDLPEISLLRRLVHGRRFEFVLDFHEDWESPGYYLYELRRGAPVLGHRVIAAVSRVCPINHNPQIEGWPADGGLIAPDPDQEVGRRGAGIPLAMFYGHTDHLLTSESASALGLAVRVAAHTAALEAVLQAHQTGTRSTRGAAAAEAGRRPTTEPTEARKVPPDDSRQQVQSRE
jgi:murein peptide amidase A